MELELHVGFWKAGAHAVALELVDLCGRQVGTNIRVPFQTIDSGAKPSSKAKFSCRNGPNPHPVPQIVHFIFGLKPNFGGKPFSLVHYAAVRSAYLVLRPERMSERSPTSYTFKRKKYA